MKTVEETENPYNLSYLNWKYQNRFSRKIFKRLLIPDLDGRKSGMNVVNFIISKDLLENNR